MVGILVNSRTAAFYTVIGAFLPILLAVLPGIDAETLNMGLMGYNGVLCAIALGNRTLKSLVWVSCSVLLSVILQIIGMSLEITTLTAPFVVSVWVIMGIQKLVNPKQQSVNSGIMINDRKIRETERLHCSCSVSFLFYNLNRKELHGLILLLFWGFKSISFNSKEAFHILPLFYL